MRIVMFSINPLFPDRVMGGAPRQLQKVAIHMGELGHEVVVLCTQAKGTDQPFKWHDRVVVRPLLKFKQPFPAPYNVPAYDIATILQDIGGELATADRFYMHDGELLFPYVYQHVPTVVSLRDNVYPETIHGGFLFQSHRLILISEYSRAYYQSTVGRFFPELAERIVVVHNGLEFDRMKPTPPSEELLRLLPFDPAQHTLILHPHRPEPTKGIPQTLAVVDLLVHQYKMTDIKTLIPRWLDLQLSPDLQAFYDEVEREIAARGLQNNVVFHDWLPQKLLPEYYTLGAVTFSLGSFPESFGNAVYESLACGTPSLAARIATHRELLPDHLIDKVDYDDAVSAAKLAVNIIREKRRTSSETLAYLHEHYSVGKQLKGYADAILNAEVVPPMTYRHPMLDDTTRYELAPWCYISQNGLVYHDFRADYVSMGELGIFLRDHPEGILLNNSLISRDDILHWFRAGYLTP